MGGSFIIKVTMEIFILSWLFSLPMYSFSVQLFPCMVLNPVQFIQFSVKCSSYSNKCCFINLSLHGYNYNFSSFKEKYILEEYLYLHCNSIVISLYLSVSQFVFQFVFCWSDMSHFHWFKHNCQIYLHLYMSI